MRCEKGPSVSDCRGNVTCYLFDPFRHGWNWAVVDCCSKLQVGGLGVHGNTGDRQQGFVGGEATGGRKKNIRIKMRAG